MRSPFDSIDSEIERWKLARAGLLSQFPLSWALPAHSLGCCRLQMTLSDLTAEAEMLRALAAHPELALPNVTTQRGEDQPLDECEQALRAALAADVCDFLRRHGRLLRYDDLALFDRRLDGGDTRDSMLADVLKDLRLRLSPASQRRSATVRNRRFNYLTRRLAATDYFSVEAMASRRPELYAQYTKDKVAGDETHGGSMDPPNAVEQAAIEDAQAKKFRNEVGASSVAHWGALPAAEQSQDVGGNSCAARSTGLAGSRERMWGEFETSSATEDAAQSKKLRQELADTFTERGRQEQLRHGSQPDDDRSCGQIVADIQRMATGTTGNSRAELSGAVNGETGMGVSPWQAGAADEADEDSTAYQLMEFTEAMKRLWLNGEEALFDYDAVDLNAANDDWQQQQQDQEEDYFNGEDEYSASGEDGEWNDNGDGIVSTRRQQPSEASRKRERDALRARALAALSS